jgi:hypothetical protein
LASCWERFGTISGLLGYMKCGQRKDVVQSLQLKPPIQNGMLNCHCWRILRKFKKTAWRGGLNVTYQFLTYTFCLLGKDINITKKNTEGMLVTTKDVGMELNVDRTKYKHMLIITHYPVQSHNMCVLINPVKMWPCSNIWEHQQNSLLIVCRLNSINAWYHHFSIFRSPARYLKTQSLEYTEL